MREGHCPTQTNRPERESVGGRSSRYGVAELRLPYRLRETALVPLLLVSKVQNDRQEYEPNSNWIVSVVQDEPGR